MQDDRLTTGIPPLDAMLGRGLLPGTTTVVLGATGIGKSQLGLAFADAGLRQEGERGIVFDMTSRGDSQNHRDYARRLFDWELMSASPNESFDPQLVWGAERSRRDSLHLFEQAGRRVTTTDMDFAQQQEWKADLNRKLQQTIAFFYGNFIHGVRRCVIDGIEPTDRASDSFQFELFQYLHHQIMQKEADWVARDLFRAQFRENETRVQEHMYDHQEIGCLMLCTTHEVLLDDLLARPLQSGDVLSNANTIILMGKQRTGDRMGRALHVAKHRGSACDDRIVPFDITESGLEIKEH